MPLTGGGFSLSAPRFPMDFKTRTLQELRARRGSLTGKQALLGLDGFVDTIVAPVALRAGQGENFTPMATIAEFGQRIVAAAGKSTNIELYPRMEKLGGNGPIMAHAILAQGAEVTYVGALGTPSVHPVFVDFERRVKVGDRPGNQVGIIGDILVVEPHAQPFGRRPDLCARRAACPH